MKREWIWFWVVIATVVVVNAFYLIPRRLGPTDSQTFTPVPIGAVLVVPNQEGDIPVPIKPRYDVLEVFVRSDLLTPLMPLKINQSVANFVIAGLAVVGLLIVRPAGKKKDTEHPPAN